MLVHMHETCALVVGVRKNDKFVSYFRGSDRHFDVTNVSTRLQVLDYSTLLLDLRLIFMHARYSLHGIVSFTSVHV